MADSAQQLAEYKTQLQQVEAALTVDQGNEDLNKLKTDLLEVIQLTQDLLNVQTLTEQQEEDVAAGGSTEPAATASASAPSTSSHTWSVGDSCMCVYGEDGQLYPATIDETLPDGTCTVTFEEYGNTEVTKLSQLKPVESDYPTVKKDGSGRNIPMTKKDLALAQREYKRKKSQKKAQRQKVLEEERETEKNKWLDFNSKTFSKTNKGKVKRSIFATPETVGGRVGVGTCGIGGQPMTDYTHQEKWTKK